MGVFLRIPIQRITLTPLPHARGGVSWSNHPERIGNNSSPRPWGCFYSGTVNDREMQLFPTPVGVFLELLLNQHPERALPHARGGVSQQAQAANNAQASSPRPWGCFLEGGDIVQQTGLFPTPVGVFPGLKRCSLTLNPLPHARGGVSNFDVELDRARNSSPRPWGCFLHIPDCQRNQKLFPTPVGVFPGCSRRISLKRTLPHARGGVSGRLRTYP